MPTTELRGRACNKRLRVAFCRLADSSRHWHPWAQDLYTQARHRGHEHPRAIRTLERAWCRVVWQCWRNHTPYHPARHRALQRHITVTIPTPSGPVPDLAATSGWLAPLSPTRRPARAERAALDSKPPSATAHRRLTQDVFGDNDLLSIETDLPIHSPSNFIGRIEQS